MGGGVRAEPEDTAATAHIQVPGFSLIPDCISAEEEAALLAEVDGGAWQGQASTGVKRRVQHYGFRFSYNTLMIDHLQKAPPLPPACMAVAQRFCKESSLLEQLTVNEYLPGQGIASHIDTPHCLGPTIYFLSLSSGVTMTLTRNGGSSSGSSVIKKHVFLPPRSLLCLTGDARFEFSHGIAPRVTDKVDGVIYQRGRRVSLTFRQPLLLGTFPSPLLVPSQLEATEMESYHLRKTVDENGPSPEISSFLDSLSIGSLLLSSASPCSEQKRMGVVSVDALRCDWAKLPWRSECFDAALCVNVLNLLASKERRVEAVRELVRCVKPGGRILLQASLRPSVHAFRLGELQDLCSYVAGCRLLGYSGSACGLDWNIQLGRTAIPALQVGPCLPLPAFEKRGIATTEALPR